MSSAVESFGKKLIYEFEKRQGRKPNFQSDIGYDMKSSKRFIEIKARQRDYPKSAFFFISKAQHKMLKYNRNFYIYVIYNLIGGNKNPKLKLISTSTTFKIN